MISHSFPLSDLNVYERLEGSSKSIILPSFDSSLKIDFKVSAVCIGLKKCSELSISSYNSKNSFFPIIESSSKM